MSKTASIVSLVGVIALAGVVAVSLNTAVKTSLDDSFQEPVALVSAEVVEAGEEAVGPEFDEPMSEEFMAVEYGEEIMVEDNQVAAAGAAVMGPQAMVKVKGPADFDLATYQSLGATRVVARWNLDNQSAFSSCALFTSRTGNGMDWKQVGAKVPATTEMIEDKRNPIPEGTNYYRVKCNTNPGFVSDHGTYAWSNGPLSVKFPNFPRNLVSRVMYEGGSTATNNNSGQNNVVTNRVPQVQLTWQDTSKAETGFQIYRSCVTGNNSLEKDKTKWEKLGKVPANTTMFIDKTVKANNYCGYYVQAYMGKDGEEAWSLGSGTTALRVK
jgi:hypothetical protein